MQTRTLPMLVFLLPQRASWWLLGHAAWSGELPPVSVKGWEVAAAMRGTGNPVASRKASTHLPVRQTQQAGDTWQCTCSYVYRR